ncbi:Glutathione S-transferase [Chelatococcus sambhunathii]|uniref:Glutathione S-transferase n=1 Tax=Chelatococcus sambhunathii TaxID=363953 RepID=A0ABM9U6A4_9HYPH|nr:MULTISPECIES: glutathione S-transferase [Chelatococcus]CUA89116.1 Glutathione S-transferase [Chelatococcus sambhunathii]
MSDYILHCFGQSGNAYKVALMLNLCGCDWQPRFVDFFNGETRSPAFRDSCNEMGEVPVLEHGGQRLSQSGAILTLLAERHGRFGGHDAGERYDILRWILFDNHKFTSYFATLRFMVGLKKMGESPVTEFLRGRALAAFDIVEKHLAKRSFMVGETPTIADISMVGYLYYPEDTGIDRSAFPNIDAWTRRIAALPGWAHPYDLMPREPG